MSYNPIFGIGECTAQVYAFKVLWLQHRRVNGINDNNRDFSRFYYYVTSREMIVPLYDGKLTMGMPDGYHLVADPRFKPVDFANLKHESECRADWSERMQMEYPWLQYIDDIRPEDHNILRSEVLSRIRY